MSILIHFLEPWHFPLHEALPRLSSEEREQVERFVFEKDACRWASYRAQVRAHLGKHLGVSPDQVDWRTEEHGKPYLPGVPVHFNVSHCDDLGVLALSKLGPLGIDLEARSRAPELVGCEAAFCHPDECVEVAALPPADRPIRLLEIWTAKEAALKCLGTGLTHPPQEVMISDQRAIGELASLDELTIHRPEHPLLARHMVALATAEKTPDWIWL